MEAISKGISQNFWRAWMRRITRCISPEKQNCLKKVTGEVLEIGPGTGVNFPFLKNENMNWIGCEPNPAMHPYLLRAAERNGIEARILNCSTEKIDLPDSTMDFVISTEVLCSVKDLDQSLSEIRRVLKPGGQFLFLEHVVDQDNLWRRIVQKAVPYTPWKFYSDGCHPARDIGGAIRNAGFSQVQFTPYMREGSGIIISINRPHICGSAIN